MFFKVLPFFLEEGCRFRVLAPGTHGRAGEFVQHNATIAAPPRGRRSASEMVKHDHT
jgi:hypothetical protein